MRLILFVKIPGQLEPIPLDIVDDRAARLVLEDILLLTSLSAKDKSHPNYELIWEGNKIDLNRNMSENGIKNGALLEVNQIDNPIAIKNWDGEKEDMKQTVAESLTPVKKGRNSTEKKVINTSPVPGKKIDFD